MPDYFELSIPWNIYKIEPKNNIEKKIHSGNKIPRNSWSESGGKYDEAIEYYDKALQLDPNYILAWNNKQLDLNRRKKKKR